MIPLFSEMKLLTNIYEENELNFKIVAKAIMYR